MKLRVAAVLLFLIVIASSAFAEPRYLVTNLGPVDSLGRGTFGRAINNHRQIACTLSLGAPLYLWDKGSYTDLGIRSPRYARGARCVDINDACQITGVTSDQRPCIWQNGIVTDIGALDGKRGATIGINDSGQVVGSYNGRAVLWEQGTITDIVPLDWLSRSSCAYAISDNGIIVGQADGHAFMVSNSAAVLVDTVNKGFCEPGGVNNTGTVVGQADFYGGGSTLMYTAFMYSNGAMTDLGSLNYDRQSKANAINNAGQIVGMSYIDNLTPGTPPKRAVTWEDGITCDLNNLIAPGSGLILMEAWDINDRGDIVGEAFLPGVGPRGFLLTPWLVEVNIDIRPGTQPNEINIIANQPVPVAVFSSQEFDANYIDYVTVCFAGAKAYRREIADINRDGKRDMVFWFRANQLDLYSNDTTAKLTGRTRDGRPFEGIDGVVVHGRAERPMPLQPHYTFTELSLLPGTDWSIPYGINNAGQIVGECAGEPCLWENGSVRYLEYPGTRFSCAYDINDSGQVTMLTNQGTFLWSNGSFTKMEVPGAKAWMPLSINNSGAVAGWGYYSVEDIWSRYAYVWQNGQGSILMPPYGDASYAQGINDSGLVVGYFDAPDQSGQNWITYPCAWSNGTAAKLPLPDLFDEGQAMAVNNRGDIAGICRQNSGNYIERACLWHNNTPQILKPIDADPTDRIRGLNDWGQIVGASYIMSPDASRHVSVLWHAGKAYDLGEITTGLADGWELFEAVGINNSGQIIGSAWGPDVTDRAFILNPIPAQVTIDIRPGDPNNLVNTRSQGILPVAVYSNEELTTSSLLLETITLSGAKPDKWQIVDDMNGDGRKDMILMFRSSDLNISANASEALLTGRTFDGWWIEGSDRIKPVSGGRQ